MGVLANGNSTRSVIYSSYLFQGRPNPCSDEVAQWLRREKPSCADSNCIETTVDEVVDADKVTAEESAQNNDVVRRVVRRLVVGHQPHADAPLVLHVNGVQVGKFPTLQSLPWSLILSHFCIFRRLSRPTVPIPSTRSGPGLNWMLCFHNPTLSLRRLYFKHCSKPPL